MSRKLPRRRRFMNLVLLCVLFLLSTLFIFEMKHSLKRSSVTNELINEYAGELTGPKRQELIAKVYDYCARDRKLKKIIKKYQATEEDFIIFIDFTLTAHLF